MSSFHVRIFRSIVAMVVVGVMLVGAGAWASTASAQQPVPSIYVGFEEGAVPGEEIVVSAYLLDPAGNPIYDEVVHFSYVVEFLNTEGSVEIGQAETDGDGLAWLLWEPRSTGSVQVTASFEGSDVFAPISDAKTLEMLPGTQLYKEFSPYRIPGANVWLTSGLITTVWVIFIASLATVGWANFKTRNEPHSAGSSGGGHE